MILPRSRLVFWTAITLAPLGALLPMAAAGLTPLVAAAITLYAVVVIADALAASRGLDGITLDFPDLVRLQKDRTGSISLLICAQLSRPRLLRLGVLFPETFDPVVADWTVLVPAETPISRTDLSCRPSVRGQFFLSEIHLETSSPLGLWSGRRRQAVRCEVRVYPNLFDERRKVASLFLRQSQIGVHAQRLAGQGRDFEKLRGYLPGDSLGDIHWKASAKRGEAVTKVYQIERTHEVYVAIDASRLSARPIGGAGDGGEPGREAKSALERYVTAALILALAAEQQGDQFGLITFSDRILKFVRARSGQAHFDTCRDALYTLQAQRVSPDFEEFATFVRTKLRKRALLIVLTSLDDPALAESFTRAVELISRQHLLLVNVLKPAEVAPLFSDPLPVHTASEIYDRLGGHLQWRGLRELQKVLQRRGIRLSMVEADRLSSDVVTQHAEVRARQLQ